MCPENKNIMKVVECMILKQAIRDLASKDTNLSESASDFFKSSNYKELCLSLEIDKSMMDKSIKELETYPLISKKKLANKMAIMLDGFSRE
tara:strand:+ start:2959 stop:3231 length:273 start_codon:yes stop_codon:yes gene_type:complete